MIPGEIRTRLAAIFVLAVVFLSGAFVGMAIDGTTARAEAGPRAPSQGAEATSNTGAAGDSRSEEKLLRRIDLSPEQREVVDRLLHDYHATIAEFQAEYRPRYWAIVDTTRATIRGVLDPPQAVLYDSLLAENDRRRGRPGSEHH